MALAEKRDGCVCCARTAADRLAWDNALAEQPRRQILKEDCSEGSLDGLALLGPHRHEVGERTLSVQVDPQLALSVIAHARVLLIVQPIECATRNLPPMGRAGSGMCRLGKRCGIQILYLADLRVVDTIDHKG